MCPSHAHVYGIVFRKLGYVGDSYWNVFRFILMTRLILKGCFDLIFEDSLCLNKSEWFLNFTLKAES